MSRLGQPRLPQLQRLCRGLDCSRPPLRVDKGIGSNVARNGTRPQMESSGSPRDAGALAVRPRQHVRLCPGRGLTCGRAVRPVEPGVVDRAGRDRFHRGGRGPRLAHPRFGPCLAHWFPLRSAPALPAGRRCPRWSPAGALADRVTLWVASVSPLLALPTVLAALGPPAPTCPEPRRSRKFSGVPAGWRHRRRHRRDRAGRSAG